MRHEPQGLERWANTDPSMHCNTIPKAGPDWRNEYLKLLIGGDHEGARALRVRNDPKYAAETEPSVTVLKTEQAPLKSCRDVQIEQEESEAA